MIAAETPGLPVKDSAGSHIGKGRKMLQRI
jgi:hypothetical protein